MEPSPTRRGGLEAKIISRDGMALSLLSEPIENPKQGNYDKQDCELKAFKRLAKRLKELFPRQKIVLLVDSDYAGAPFFTICNDNQWQFICTFKPGSIPTLFEEAMALLELEKDNLMQRDHNGARNSWRWLDYLPYHVGKQELRLGFLDYPKTAKGDDRYFSWLTGFTPSRDNVRKLTEAGRRRWKIENEGFNEQKNGYSMEHFCHALRVAQTPTPLSGCTCCCKSPIRSCSYWPRATSSGGTQRCDSSRTCSWNRSGTSHYLSTCSLPSCLECRSASYLLDETRSRNVFAVTVTS